MPRPSYVAVALAVAMATALMQTVRTARPAVAADTPGRYTMSPAVGGGFVRLDTQTGQMSLCNRIDTQWKCDAMADDGRGLAADIEKLRADNQRLREEVRRLDEMVLSARPGGAPPGSSQPGRKLELPSEEDVDRAMTYLQRMFKKFQDKLKEFEPNNLDKPKPAPTTPL